jgi:hypothetical protein
VVLPDEDSVLWVPEAALPVVPVEEDPPHAVSRLAHIAPASSTRIIFFTFLILLFVDI